MDEQKLYYRFLNNSNHRTTAGVVRIVDLAWSPNDEWRSCFHEVYGNPTPEKVLESFKKLASIPLWLTLDVIRVIWPGHPNSWWDSTVWECTINEDGIIPKTGYLDESKRLIKV